MDPSGRRTARFPHAFKGAPLYVTLEQEPGRLLEGNHGKNGCEATEQRREPGPEPSQPAQPAEPLGWACKN